MRFLLLACLYLTGCISSQIFSTYPYQLHKDFEYENINFVIIDRSDLKKVFIRPTAIGGAFSLGSKKSAIGNDGVMELEKQVLIEFFENQNKKCQFNNGKELANVQFEFDYTCK
ncbi:MAG: hypothetical protein QXN55_00025 [Candidatus Nitrosotenuis sp.]